MAKRSIERAERLERGSIDRLETSFFNDDETSRTATAESRNVSGEREYIGSKTDKRIDKSVRYLEQSNVKSLSQMQTLTQVPAIVIVALSVIAVMAILSMLIMLWHIGRLRIFAWWMLGLIILAIVLGGLTLWAIHSKQQEED